MDGAVLSNGRDIYDAYDIKSLFLCMIRCNDSELHYQHEKL